MAELTDTPVDPILKVTFINGAQHVVQAKNLNYNGLRQAILYKTWDLKRQGIENTGLADLLRRVGDKL